ncbi:UNVERIFIED_CONTAM: hypothetical protein K2H54_039651 [Gekko kuhli]
MGPEDPDEAQEAALQAREEDEDQARRQICKEPLSSEAQHGNQAFRQEVEGKQAFGPQDQKIARKKQAKGPEPAAPPKSRRRTRKNENEIFYSMANTSTPEGTAEEKQSKKHSVHFANPANARTKEAEMHLQDDSVDNQPGQQVPKKRSRHSATSSQKSR